MMVAEGDEYALSRSLSALGLIGSVSAVVDWGDGSTSNATVQGGQAASQLTARIDYSLDTSGFFTTARRQLLQSAVDSVLGRFGDTLTAIAPSGANTWTAVFSHPSTGQTVQRPNLSIARNEILIFAGARPMAGASLGSGGPGGYSASGSSAFLENLQTRGQGATVGSTATDFGPWGGSLSFDTTATWHFGTGTESLDSGESDFVTTAVHEAMHLLGFGTSDSWRRLVSGSTFTGPKSRAAFDGSGNIPLSSGNGHWANGLEDGGEETLMDPNQTSGSRKAATALDMAGLDDLGWEVLPATARVTADHVYADDGSYPVRVTLSGGRLGTRVDAFQVNVTNVAPALTMAADRTVEAGRRLSITDLGKISDPGFRNTSANPDTVETFTYSIDWGDGTPVQRGEAAIDQIGNATRPTLASVNGSHTYASAGTYTVKMTVLDDDDGSDSSSMVVRVTAPPVLAITTNRGRISEEGGARATVTIRRSGGDPSQPLVVNLASNDTTEATVPATVTIPASADSVTATVTSVDDDLLDGDQTVRITAGAPGIDSAAVDLVVSDAESLAALFVDPVVDEGAGDNGARLRIRRGNTDTALPLVVTISGGNTSELQAVTSATIPAGRQSVDIALDVVDDNKPDRTQSVTLSVSALGYTGSSATLTVEDNEPPFFRNPLNPLDVNNDGLVRPIDALRIINFLNRNGGPRDLDPASDPPLPYWDVNGDYQVSPLDALRIINAINRGEEDREPLLRGLITST